MPSTALMVRRPRTAGSLRPWCAGLAAAALGGVLLLFGPGLELGFFAAGAAKIAGLLTGIRALRIEEGWLLAVAPRPVVVTAACSGTDFFLIVAALLGWQLARRTRRVFVIVPALALAAALTLLINALRIVAVTHAHHWVIPRLPEAYGSFAHMFIGVAVFLPSLIALNLLLENHGNARRTSTATRD